MGFGQSVVAAISSLSLSHTDPICCIFHKKVHSPTHCVILNLQHNREMAHITWAVGLCAAGGSRGNYVMYSVRLHGDTEVEHRGGGPTVGQRANGTTGQVPFSTSSGSSSSSRGWSSSSSTAPAASPGTNL